MNLVDCIVTQILSEPYEAHGRWWVDVMANAYGNEQKTHVMCQTESDAKSIEVGHKFLA